MLEILHSQWCIVLQAMKKVQEAEVQESQQTGQDRQEICKNVIKKKKIFYSKSIKIKQHIWLSDFVLQD